MSRILSRLFIGALVLVVAPLWSFAQPVASAREASRSFWLLKKHVLQVSNGTLTLSHVTADGVPHLLVGHPQNGVAWLPVAARRSSEAVRQALIDHVPEYRSVLSLPEAAELRLSGLEHTGILWHATFGLFYSGIPVRERSLNVNLGEQTGYYVNILNDLPVLTPESPVPAISPESLTAAKLSGYLHSGAILHVEQAPRLVYVQNNTNQVLDLCYEAVLRDTVNAHLWRITVNAQTGIITDQRDLLEYVGQPKIIRSGRVVALVHPQSPYDSTVLVGMPEMRLLVDSMEIVTDSDGFWSALCYDTSTIANFDFESAYQSVSRADTTNSCARGKLVNEGLVLEWDDSNSHPSERDAYYSATRAHHYAKLLDTTLVTLDAHTDVRVNLNQTCNAYYDPSQTSINFFRSGNSCSNTAEIADVVYHEYGHRMLHARYATTPHGNIVNSSLNEAFADCFSALLRDDSRIGIGFYTTNRYATLRDCFNAKVFPRDISNDPHITGQILSGSFWDLRRTVGHAVAQKLFYDALVLNPDAPNSTSTSDIETGTISTLMAVIAADDTDNDLTNGTPHLNDILSAFARHGIVLANLIDLQADGIADQDTLTTSYSVAAVASYDGLIGDLSDSSVSLYYSFDNGQSYERTMMLRSHDSLFVGEIPKAPAGTMVRYYTGAYTTVPNGGSTVYPSTTDPFSFLVGYHRTFFDDAEQDKGWVLSSPTDKAKTGLWVRGVPYGTYQTEGNFIQQDSDHTPNGTACYVTGNKATRSFSEDDVDSGSTTLMTPSFDLTTVRNPVVRYWYTYWNNYGFYAGKAPWQAQVSSDDGTTWKSVQNTPSATDGWQSYTFRVSDKVTPSATMRMRFIATDFYATVVEAAVDDFEVLSAPDETIAAVIAPMTAKLSLSLPHPNPVRVASGSSSVTISIPSRGRVVLQLKNVMGEIVRTLFDENVEASAVTLPITTAGLPSGTYWLVLNAGPDLVIRRLTIE
jgi:hypothetical protein